MLQQKFLHLKNLSETLFETLDSKISPLPVDRRNVSSTSFDKGGRYSVYGHDTIAI